MSWVKKVENENITYSYKEALVHKLCNLSPFLPKTYDVSIQENGKKLVIKMEKLAKKLETKTDETKLQSWKNILQAVALLNFFGIAHRDIKSDNIMFRNGKEAVLIDFGLSKPLFGGFHTPNIISKFYRPPELDETLPVQKYGFEIDSWSLAIWALEMWNPKFDHVEFLRCWSDNYNNPNELAVQKFDEYVKHVPEKIRKIVTSFLLPVGQRKTSLDWVKIDANKFLFSYPPDLKCLIPKEMAEWSTAYKSIYWSLKKYFPDVEEKWQTAMSVWACSLLILPNELDSADIANEYGMPESMLTGRVLEWFVQWKIQKK